MPSDSFIHSIAGAAGGILAMTATYPLVFLSTRAANETKENTSTHRAVADVLKREGFFGLYSGLNSSLLGIAITNGVYYYFYESSKGFLVRSRTGSKALSTLESMLAGLIAGSATSVISNPVWVIQTAQTVRGMDACSVEAAAPPPQKRLGVFETAARLLQTGGPAVFFRGLGPALVLVVNPVLQYTVFEQLKNALVRRRRNSGRVGALLTDWDFFVLGAISKLIATGVTYPYIVVKSLSAADGIQHVHFSGELNKGWFRMWTGSAATTWEDAESCLFVEWRGPGGQHLRASGSVSRFVTACGALGLARARRLVIDLPSYPSKFGYDKRTKDLSASYWLEVLEKLPGVEELELCPVGAGASSSAWKASSPPAVLPALQRVRIMANLNYASPKYTIIGDLPTRRIVRLRSYTESNVTSAVSIKKELENESSGLLTLSQGSAG